MNSSSPAAILVAVIGVFSINHFGYSEELTPSDHVVIEGRKLEVLDATFGTVHSVQTPGGKIGRTTGSDSQLALWVLENGKQDAAIASRVETLEIRLPDGQILLGRSGGSSQLTQDYNTAELGSFSVIPWREKVLDVRFRVAGTKHQLRFPNPAYKPNLPAWKPQALPLTWEKDGLRVTLRSMGVAWNEGSTYKGVRWELRPEWSITSNGKPVDDWYRVGWAAEDPGGNRSHYGGILGEPAWKLLCSLSPSYAFPFKDEDVRWFGFTDPKTAESIKPGQCEILPLDPESRSRGILFAGLFAPGEYVIEDGKIVDQRPLASKEQASLRRPSIDPTNGRLKMTVVRTAFIRHVRRNLEQGWEEVWQNEAGESVYLGGQGTQLEGETPISTTLWKQELFGAQDKPFRYGIARTGEPHRFEFMVQPPRAPRR